MALNIIGDGGTARAYLHNFFGVQWPHESVTGIVHSLYREFRPVRPARGRESWLTDDFDDLAPKTFAFI